MDIPQDNNDKPDEIKAVLQIISDVLFNTSDFPDDLPGNREEQIFLEKIILKIKELQQQITLCDDQFARLLNLFPEPIIITDNNGIIFANHTFLMLIKGEKTEDILRKRLRNFIIPDHSNSFWNNILKSADYNSAVLFPFQSLSLEKTLENNLILDFHSHDHFLEEIVCLDNEKCVVDFTPAYIQHNKNSAILIVMHDYTKEIAIQKALEKEGIVQIEKNMEQFQVLNDQIRNPLTIISAIASLLDDNSAAKKIIQQTVIINDLVTKLDKGWIESEKVRSFLLRHYRHGDEL